MNPLEQLKEKIYLKCPELKELSFGCIIQYGDETMIYSHKNNDFFVFVRGDKTAGVDRNYEHAIKILGHPILPHHILRCLGSDYAMDGDGYILELDMTYGQEHYLKTGKVKYNILLPLDQQEPEVIEFLLNNI